MPDLDIDSYLHDIDSGGLDKLQEVAHYIMGSPYVVKQVIGGINTNIIQLKKFLKDSDGFKELRANEVQQKTIVKLITKIKNNFLVIKGYTDNSNISKKSEQECNGRISRFEVAMTGLIKSLNRKGLSLDLKVPKTITLPKEGESYHIENWSPERENEFRSVENQQSYIDSPSNINDYVGNIISLAGSLDKNAAFTPDTVGSQLLEDVKGNAKNIKDKLEVIEEETPNRIQTEIISQLMDRMQNKFLLVQKQLSYQSPEIREGYVKESISHLETNVMGLAKSLNEKGMSLDLDKFTPRFIPAANQSSSEDLGKWSSKAKDEQDQINEFSRGRQ